MTGEGRYSADVAAEGAAWAVVVRSPHAHADILAIDIGKAEKAPGILGVFTGADLAADDLGHIPCLAPVEGKGGSETFVPPHPALAIERVYYVGEPVALVVAETQDQARDASELVEVHYRGLPSVNETALALDPAAPQIWPEAPRNIAVDWETGDADEVARAFDQAAHVTKMTLVNNRVAANPMEPRAALGEYEKESGRLTLTTPSQGVYAMRAQLADHIFKLPEDRIRVVTPDVGGAFGSRGYCNSEQILVLWAARRLDRPVRWTADRGECFFTDGMGRDHVSQAELALDAKGRFLGLRVSIAANMGAYVINWGPSIPTEYCTSMLTGCYRLPAIQAEVKCVFTNMVPIDTYRGTGRAEGIYLLERLVDVAARDLGLSPAEIRRRNFVQPYHLPHTTPTGLTYDSGDFPAILEQALTLADWAGAERRKAEAAAAGKLLGIGLAAHIARGGGVSDEHARLRLDSDGGITLFIGTQSSGQGHATVYAQLVSERLNIPFDLVCVRQGDSDHGPRGGITAGSRSLQMGGLAIQGAADALIEKARGLAGYLMQVDGAELTFEGPAFTVTGTDRRITLAEIARAADETGEARLPVGMIHPIEASYDAEQAPETFANGCHICELLVDPETGQIEIRSYLIVDDYGRVINPQLCAGQVHGAVAQGIGQALLERVVYDSESGQLLTGSLMDYCLPRADDLPAFQVTLFDGAQCKTNVLGVKGAAEAGTIAAAPAVMNAVIDAVAPLGVRHLDMPATPERVWRAIANTKQP
ncbi:MAG: xanthine dehydrogenase family protein molybdopterin-binding subunit [Kiloniellales bacterium]